MPRPGLFLPDSSSTRFIINPQDEISLRPCYQLRWQVLRQPWGQPHGSERDTLDNESIHKAIQQDNRIIATGRLHFLEYSTGCLRYMAVHPDFQRMGIGKILLDALESAAYDAKVTNLVLQSRESAVSFYLHNGYQLIRKSHLLYNEIQHFEMTKTLSSTYRQKE